jgi:hypothetical protein
VYSLTTRETWFPKEFILTKQEEWSIPKLFQKENSRKLGIDPYGC